MDARQLSGGERFKALLAKIFLTGTLPELLVLDEPTNNLGFDSLELFMDALKEFKAALMVVNHDSHFVSHLGVMKELSL